MMVTNTFNNRIEPGFNAPNNRVEPGLHAAPKPTGTWWYRNAGVSIGPVTDEQMQALVSGGVVDRSTMVWRDEFGANWKRLDETGLWKEPSGPPAFEQPVSPRWQKTFDLFEAEARAPASGPLSFADKMKRAWRTGSIPGFIFGPLYYFYLGMWRKGIWICALIPIIGLIQEITSKAGAFSSIIPIYCFLNVKRDYYKKVIKGETLWQKLAFSRNVWTDAGIAAGALVLCVGVIALTDEGSGSASASGGPTTRAASSDLMSVEKKRFIGTDGRIDGMIWNLVFTSKTGNIDFKSVSVNRGNCQIPYVIPKTLAFGETTEAMVYCNPIEATVQTDRGSFTVTWNR